MRIRNSMLLAAAALCLGLPLDMPKLSASAEAVVRCGIPMAVIPLTADQRDRGVGAHPFSTSTACDPLVARDGRRRPSGRSMSEGRRRGVTPAIVGTTTAYLVSSAKAPFQSSGGGFF
jgi:hypothetical protein